MKEFLLREVNFDELADITHATPTRALRKHTYTRLWSVLTCQTYIPRRRDYGHCSALDRFHV